jgi:hypothetical protein
VQLFDRSLQLFDDNRCFVDQPNFSRRIASLFSREECDGCIDSVLLLAKVKDVAVGLGPVEDPIGTRECLD